ncbi:MAG: stealth family protein [Muribaculaceae bacterium]|nr:stealth family protein [Muribaculaceae bacterium]
MNPDNNTPLDLVYLWVDGNDPTWQAKRDAVIGKAVEGSAVNCKGRYANNDELKYSLRSAQLYAPWLRRIFIVTDGQVPEWLDTSNPKIRIVDHSEILPTESLPCFNSTLIEQFLYRIPDLSERFLYANDDMFFNRPVQPSDFYAPDGLPLMRFSYRRPFRKLLIKLRTELRHKKLSHYNQKVENSARLVEQRFGKYYSYKGHHNIDAYLKSNYRHIHETFKSEIDTMLTHHVRSDRDYQRHLYSYAALAEGMAHKRFVGRDTSFHLFIHRPDHYIKLDRSNPMLFCMNDSEYAADQDRRREVEYLEKRFPEKSEFEL